MMTDKEKDGVAYEHLLHSLARSFSHRDTGTIGPAIRDYVDARLASIVTETCDTGPAAEPPAATDDPFVEGSRWNCDENAKIGGNWHWVIGGGGSVSYGVDGDWTKAQQFDSPAKLKETSGADKAMWPCDIHGKRITPPAAKPVPSVVDKHGREIKVGDRVLHGFTGNRGVVAATKEMYFDREVVLVDWDDKTSGREHSAYSSNLQVIDPTPPAPQAETGKLTFAQLRDANIKRLPLFKNRKGERAHSKPDGADWCLAQWCNAVLGELGEAANMIKKIERGDMSLDDARVELAKELADVATYLDILAFRAGVDLGDATAAKFNEVSDRVGCDVKLPVNAALLAEQAGTGDKPTPAVETPGKTRGQEIADRWYGTTLSNQDLIAAIDAAIAEAKAEQLEDHVEALRRIVNNLDEIKQVESAIRASGSEGTR